MKMHKYEFMCIHTHMSIYVHICKCIYIFYIQFIPAPCFQSVPSYSLCYFSTSLRMLYEYVCYLYIHKHVYIYPRLQDSYMYVFFVHRAYVSVRTSRP